MPIGRCTMKANIVIQSNIKQEQNSLLIPNNRENPPSPNERLSKDYRIGDIKASTYASHKTHGVVRQSLTRLKVPRSHKPMMRRFGTTP